MRQLAESKETRMPCCWIFPMIDRSNMAGAKAKKNVLVRFTGIIYFWSCLQRWRNCLTAKSGQNLGKKF